MRLSGTVFGTLALLLGFYQAPFSHIHADDFDHPASPTLAHWHLHHGSPAASRCLVTAHTEDDDAIDVGWNALRGAAPEVPLYLIVAGGLHLPPVTSTATPAAIPHRRGHDPPELALRSPRSPPA